MNKLKPQLQSSITIKINLISLDQSWRMSKKRRFDVYFFAVANTVIRFDKILPLWHNFESF